MKKVQVGILGATGMVGQMFIHLLREHPSFTVAVLGASSSSAGKKYKDRVSWSLKDEIPERVGELVMVECTLENFTGCQIVFSALSSNVALEIEQLFAKAGIPVFSNSKNHRMHDLVPILLPLVNPAHIFAVREQKWGKSGGYIITNSNCATAGLATVLQCLEQNFGVESCFVSTMQAISGAGIRGVAGMSIVDNVIPFISGEEEKLATEPVKILGSFSTKEKKFVSANLPISAMCHRVPVLNGHLESISVKFKKPVTVEEVTAALKAFSPELLKHKDAEIDPMKLESAPEHVIVVREERDRPQPRMDRLTGNGYSVVVGGVRECSLFDIKLSLLLHNTVLGAAGGSILNAELALKCGMIQ